MLGDLLPSSRISSRAKGMLGYLLPMLGYLLPMLGYEQGEQGEQGEQKGGKVAIGQSRKQKERGQGLPLNSLKKNSYRGRS